ncbi:MAG: exo-alpha-sialidase [Rhodobacteraceae bacterium]|nr:MAG: exo-alpha-sialidase [Paracoccaceae bacterium]
MSSRTLLVGTTKGAFLLGVPDNGAAWALRGPFCDGWTINHMAGDPTTGTLWAAGGNDWLGAGVWTSQDEGASWSLAKLSNGEFDDWLANDPEMARQFGIEAAPPAPFGKDLAAIWSLHHAHGRLYAGAKPATLLVSTDNGASWEKLPALTDHPSAADWQPGAAGLTLHTIVTDPGDPAKLWLAISAAGVFASEDGGASWERRNRRDNAPCDGLHAHPAAGTADETGHCVHNMVRARGASGTDLLYQQNHHGVYRSEDGGRSWHDITAGLPSTFGFPIAVHPEDSRTLWTLPLNGDSCGRYPPEASAAVWKSRDGGETWARKQDGLPTENCFFTVLRQAMATDTAAPAGVYFGTNSGSVFASRDEGESWSEVARHLPTVLSVEVLERA